MYVSLAEKISLEKGIEQGIEKGIEKGKQEVAANMLKSGFPVEDVVRATNLPRSEVEAVL